MRYFWFKLFGILGLFAVAAAGEARADDSNYQSFIVGGRGLGLAGAFTSIGDDSSGLFYNPAGIVDTRHASIQLSSSLYGFERKTLDVDSTTLPVPGLDGLRPQFADLIVIPASAGFVSGLGEPEPDGSNRHAYGFSVLVPTFRSRNSALTSTDPSTGETTNYRRRVTDRSLWAGFGYAYRLSPRLSLGLSGYYILRNAVDNEQADGSRADPMNSDQTTFRTVSNEVTYTNGSLSLAAGAKFNVTDSLRLGVMLRAPSLHVHSDSSVRFAAGVSVPNCDPMDAACVERSVFDTLNIDGARSETQQPFSARAGISYSKEYWFNLSLDVSYYAPVDYRVIDLDPAAQALLPFNPDVERGHVVNVNFGAEYLLIREVGVTFGFFSDFSSAPRIPENPDRDYLSRNNLFGTVLSLGYFGKHTLSRVGILYSFGDGQDVIPNSNIDRLLGGGSEYSRVDIFESFFYVFVSSQFRY